MKVHPFLSVCLVLTLLAASLLPASAAPLSQTPPEPNLPESINEPDDYSILSCNGTGISGDLADLRGIVFTVSSAFRSIQVRMDGAEAGTYSFTAQLFRSSGFTGNPEFSLPVSFVLPTTASPPYLPVNE
jgi:hypothetical protein